VVYLLLHSSSPIELPRLRRCHLLNLQLCATTPKPSRCTISNKWRGPSTITESATAWRRSRSCKPWMGWRCAWGETRAYAVRITYCIGEIAGASRRARVEDMTNCINRYGSRVYQAGRREGIGPAEILPMSDTEFRSHMGLGSIILLVTWANIDLELLFVGGIFNEALFSMP